MPALIRPLRQDDEPFLWQMLYYAAHMQEDGETSSDAAKNNPGLQKYVQGWGRETDRGVLALHPHDQRPLGAAWIRLLIEEKKMSRLIPDGTPELAIAVLPDSLGQGIGTQLMKYLLEEASQVYPAVMLSVRKSNPALLAYSEQLTWLASASIASFSFACSASSRMRDQTQPRALMVRRQGGSRGRLPSCGGSKRTLP